MRLKFIFYTTLSFICLLCEMLIQYCRPFVKGFNVFNVAHGSVVIGVWTVTYIHANRLLVRVQPGQVATLDVLCCARRQGSLTALFQSHTHTHTQLQCVLLVVVNCNGLVSHPGEINDSSNEHHGNRG